MGMMQEEKKTPKTQKKEKYRNYDSAWKDVVEELFKDFLELLFPDIYQDIDFSRDYEILSTELRPMLPTSKAGKRQADVLIKVRLKTGEFKILWALIHTEIQGYKDKDFLLRLFISFYRLYEKKKKDDLDIISIAVLTDDDPGYRPSEFCYSQWGFKMIMQVPMVKLIDYEQNEELREKLETSNSPMALVIKVHLKSLKVKKYDNKRRYNMKYELYRECLRQAYPENKIRCLLKFLDYVIPLPDELSNKFTDEIIKLEEETKMAYVTSWEKIGEKRGKKEEKLETAKRMLLNDFSVEQVIIATGLNEKEVKALMN